MKGGREVVSGRGVEPARTKPDGPPCYAPCPACRTLVLNGITQAGLRLALDVQHATYTVVWENGAPQPLLSASRAYPVHVCVRKEMG
jgi:hypothetical protein